MTQSPRDRILWILPTAAARWIRSNEICPTGTHPKGASRGRQDQDNRRSHIITLTPHSAL